MNIYAWYIYIYTYNKYISWILIQMHVKVYTRNNNNRAYFLKKKNHEYYYLNMILCNENWKSVLIVANLNI